MKRCKQIRDKKKKQNNTENTVRDPASFRFSAKDFDEFVQRVREQQLYTGPTLNVDDIVIQQPMTAPTGRIFYYDNELHYENILNDIRHRGHTDEEN